MKKIVTFFLLCSMTVSLFACGGAKQKNENGTKTETKMDGKKEDKPSVAFVCTGQLGDKSFNDSANEGMKRISSELGLKTKVVEIGRDNTKWLPAYEDLAESGEWDIIVSNGSSSAEVIEQAAEEFPKQKWVMFDSTREEGKWPNLYAISYKQTEGSYLAGVLAALVTESKMEHANADKKIGFIGGDEHPIITDFLVGYIAGAKSVDPDIKVYVSYIGSWDDTAKGKETAIAQFNQGVDIIFPAAEQAGLGCVDAAVDMGKYIIGVDSDQSMLFAGSDEKKANTILTSVMKNVGESLFRTAQLQQEDKVPYGKTESLGLKEKGSCLAENSYYEKNVPEDIRKKVDEAAQEVADGKIEVPTALGDVDQKKIDELIQSVAP